MTFAEHVSAFPIYYRQTTKNSQGKLLCASLTFNLKILSCDYTVDEGLDA